MCTPLQHQEEKLGVLYVDTRGTTNAFTEGDLELLVALAGPAATAKDITLSVIPCDHRGFINMDALKDGLRKNTKLMVLNHASNVCGTLQDVNAVKSLLGDIPLLLDAAQTAGIVLQGDGATIVDNSICGSGVAFDIRSGSPSILSNDICEELEP